VGGQRRLHFGLNDIKNIVIMAWAGADTGLLLTPYNTFGSRGSHMRVEWASSLSGPVGGKPARLDLANYNNMQIGIFKGTLPRSIKLLLRSIMHY